VREFGTRFFRALTYVFPAWTGVAIFAALIGHFAAAIAGPLFAIVIVTAILGAIGCAIFGTLGVSARRLAAVIDKRADLKDRFTNAREFALRTQRSPLMDLAIADAEASAAALDPRPLIPLWTSGNGRRLGRLLFIVPLVLVFAVLYITGWPHTAKPKTPIAPGVNAVPDEFADDGFRELPESAMLLPALTGMRGVISSWRDRLAELRDRAKAIVSQGLQEPQLPETVYKEELAKGSRSDLTKQILAADGLPAVRGDSQLHLSDVKALGLDQELDSSMRQAFAQLDEQLLTEDPEIKEVQNYVDKLKTTASNNKQTSGNLMQMAGFGAQLSSDSDPKGALRNRQQAAQQQSFSEFLNQYAEHLARVSNQKQDINAQRKDQNPGQPQKVLVADQGQPLPQDAQLRLVQMTPEMARQVKLTNELGQQLDPNQAPTSRAGVGGGTFRGAMKVKHEEGPAQGQKEGLTGQVGEGKAPVQLLEDVEENNLAAYRQLYDNFQEQARAMLNDQTIPASIRAYIQRYLESISPEQLGSRH